MAGEKEVSREIPSLGDLSFSDLRDRLEQARKAFAEKKEGAEEELSAVEGVMDERTEGTYSYIQGLHSEFKEGKPIDMDDISLARDEARRIEDRNARRFIQGRITGLKREIKAKQVPPKAVEFDQLNRLIQDLREDWKEGKTIDQDLEEAKREAVELRKKDPEAGKFIRDKIARLEREVAEKRGEIELDLPEVKEEEVIGKGMKSGKKGKELPVVYLSQVFTTLKDVTLPSRERIDIQTEEGAVMARVYPVRTLEQAVTAGLTELHNMIKGNEGPFDTIQRATIRYYGGIIEGWVTKAKDKEKKKVYEDFTTLTEGVFKLFDVMYRSWLIQRGKKHEGVNDILSAASGKLLTRTMWFFRQDPEIESATHRIKGLVTDDAFRKGTSGRGELGDVEGGKFGAVEKIGYFIALLDYQRAFDGYAPVRRACYNALYLRNALRVLGTKGLYENVERLFEPRCIYYVEEKGKMVRRERLGVEPPEEEIKKMEDGDKVLRTQYGIVPYPSAHHQPGLNTEWIFENFEKDRLGWRNLARMLVIYGEHDPRWSERIRLIKQQVKQLGEEGAKKEAAKQGYYTIEEWLFATPDEQKRMYEAAWKNYETIDEVLGKESQEKKELQERIIRNNLLGIYDYAEKQPDGTLRWYTKPLLNFDEQEKDDEGKYIYIVDIGSLDPAHWCGGLEGDYLNEFYTAEEYAWRTYDIWDDLCDTSMVRQMERFRTLLRILTAREGYRHLTEEVEGRPVLMFVERRRQIEHLFTAFSESWRAWIWADRREGRRNPGGEWLSWETNVNEKLRVGLDMDRYRKEFETAGVFGIDYTNAYENAERYSYQEKVAKILAKFEHKDAWIAYLKSVVGLDQEVGRVLGLSLDEQGNVECDERGNLSPANIQILLQFAQDKELQADLEQQEDNGRIWKLYPQEGVIGGVNQVIFNEPTDEQKAKNIHQATEAQKARIILDELTYRAIVYFAGFRIKDKEGKSQEFLEYDQYGLPVWRTWFDHDFDLETGKDRGDGKERKGIFNNTQWRRIKNYLFVRLDDDLYSPFLYMNEKLEEDIVEAGIGEAYFRQTFDKDERNYTPQKWRGRIRMDKKRWDMYAHMYRNRRYTVGDLKGQYVISQLLIEPDRDTELYAFENPKTEKPIKSRVKKEKGEVLKDPRGFPIISILIDPEKNKWEVLENDRYTGLPIIKDPEVYRFRLLHRALNPGELPTPEVAWFGDPRLSGHDRIGTMTWGTEGVWSIRGENKGMGLAGLEKQLTWEPLYYNKNIRKAFFLARYGDPRYIFEVGMNTGKEWEAHQLYHAVMDEEQRSEFYQELQNIREDVGWVMAEAARDGINVGRVSEYKDLKNRKRIPDIRGEVQTGASEEELMNLVGLVKQTAGKLAGAIPLLRSGEERFCFVRGIVIGEAVTVGVATYVAGLAGTALLTPALIVGAGTIGSFLLALQFIDKGVDKEGREKARGFSRFFGSFFKLGELKGFSLGMVGYRERGRDPYNLACGYDPVYDSALPMKELVEYWVKLPKEKLVRMRVSY